MEHVFAHKVVDEAIGAGAAALLDVSGIVGIALWKAVLVLVQSYPWGGDPCVAIAQICLLKEVEGAI